MYIFLIFANTLDSKYYIVILEATKVEMKRIWDLGGSFERERERERAQWAESSQRGSWNVISNYNTSRVCTVGRLLYYVSQMNRTNRTRAPQIWCVQPSISLSISIPISISDFALWWGKSVTAFDSYLGFHDSTYRFNTTVKIGWWLR